MLDVFEIKRKFGIQISLSEVRNFNYDTGREQGAANGSDRMEGQLQRWYC